MATSSGQHFEPDKVEARQNTASSASQKVDHPEISIATTLQEAISQHRTILKVTLLGDEWNSSAGGLSTINRELAIHFSKHPKVKVSLLVPEGSCKDEEKRAAESYGITVVDAKKRPGYDHPLEWLSFPPKDLGIDVVVGHGVKLGRQGQVIRDSSRFDNCKWVQVVHTAPEDLSKYKTYSDPTSKGERKHQDEVDLCKLADLVVPVGPRLEEFYCSYLRRCKGARDFFPITPGLFYREFGDLEQAPHENADFKVLIFGRGDEEDFELKGYNIAAKAFTDQRLKQKPYQLIFVGAPEGKQEEVRLKLLRCGIAQEQLTVRKFIQSRDRMKDLLCEADLAIMPSKSEGFGLVALEALSAGLPILVGRKSGFAKALENVPNGNFCIVSSDDFTEWAKAIEAVHDRHRMRLIEIKALKASYEAKYSWEKQCEALVEKMWRMVHEPVSVGLQGVVEKQPLAEVGGEQHLNDEENEVSGTNEDAITLRNRVHSNSSAEKGPSKGSLKTPKVEDSAEQQLLHEPSEKEPRPKKRALETNEGDASVSKTGKVDDDGCEMEFTIPEVFPRDKANPPGPCELELREYQKELAEPAIQGKNSIICAPTNSGKTYVAIEITKRHLDSFTSDDADQSATSAGSSTYTNRKERRVVFIVSTLNLVLQQKERFEKFLGVRYSVGEISGANVTEIPLKYLLQSHNVVVMTAQILVNALGSENKEERVELKDISLLLFDECHHAHKEHPYNVIMEKYLTLKIQPGYPHSLPQVIGLTASLGTGKAKSVEKAEEHIILVSANLDAEVISTVQKNKAELEKFVNVMSQKEHPVLKNHQDPFEKIISKVMDRIELRLKGHKRNFIKAVPPDKSSQQYRQWVEELFKDAVAGDDRYLVTYVEQLREYNVALTLNTNTGMKNGRKHLQKYFDLLDKEKFTKIDADLEQLFHKAMQALDNSIQENGEPENRHLNKLKELLLQNYEDLQQSSKNQQPNKAKDDRENKDCNAICNMTDNVEASKLADDKSTEFTQEKDDKEKEKFAQKETSRKGDRDSPDTSNDDDSVEEANGEKGCEVMDDHKENSDSSMPDLTQKDDPDERNARHHPEWESPKGILFTTTRESTEALLDWIKEIEELNAVLRPEPLVGGGDGNIGMTKNEQEVVLKRFKTGETNLLLATSVAEEGLDIIDCNYVIRYGVMGNEISLVQSRGRVRADVGKYSVVGQSGALERERLSRFREMLMTEALAKIQKMKAEEFQRTVKDVQQKSYQERSNKKRICAVKESVSLPNDVTFLCRKCKEVVCQAHDIRRINDSHHVIINSEVSDYKVDVTKHPKPKTIDDMVIRKKVVCKKCGQDLGVTALISGVEWLLIKVSFFVLEFPDKDRPRRMYKKWKELPFSIKEAGMEEIIDKGPVDNLLDGDLDS